MISFQFAQNVERKKERRKEELFYLMHDIKSLTFHVITKNKIRDELKEKGGIMIISNERGKQVEQ